MFVVVTLLMAAALAGGVYWSRGKSRQISFVTGFGTSPRAIELLHASVAAVPANSFDARLRIVRR
jgi:hypothetical protein